MRRSALPVVLATLITLPAAAADWPQWRGPDRTNLSAETGLLSAWPAGGPSLAWKATAIGDGVVPVAVAGGRVYLTGYRDGSEYLIALAEADGKKVWEVKLGPTPKELVNMRWLNQRTPLVDGDRVYAVTVLGDWVCVRAADGLDV